MVALAAIATPDAEPSPATLRRLGLPLPLPLPPPARRRPRPRPSPTLRSPGRGGAGGNRPPVASGQWLWAPFPTPTLAPVAVAVPGLWRLGRPGRGGRARVLFGLQGPAAVGVVAKGCPPPPPTLPGPTREVLREDCGGGGARPWCLGADPCTGAAAFCYAPPVHAGPARPPLAVRAWRGGSGGGASWPPASPTAGPHHGFKAHGVWVLPAPPVGTGGRAPPAAPHPPLGAVLTAGEDGCLRAVVLGGGPPGPTSAAPPSLLIGRLVDGAALRAVAACPWRGGGSEEERGGGGRGLAGRRGGRGRRRHRLARGLGGGRRRR